MSSSTDSSVDGAGQERAVKLRIPPPCDVTLGLECVDKSEPGRTVWRMPAAEHTLNVVGNVQGGFLAALADTAMGSATITFTRAAGRQGFSASIEMKMSYFAPARPGRSLECTARIVQGGKRVLFAEAEIVDDIGVRVAAATSSYMFTELPVKPDEETSS